MRTPAATGRPRLSRLMLDGIPYVLRAGRRRLARDHEATPSSAPVFFVLAGTVVRFTRLAQAS